MMYLKNRQNVFTGIAVSSMLLAGCAAQDFQQIAKAETVLLRTGAEEAAPAGASKTNAGAGAGESGAEPRIETVAKPLSESAESLAQRQVAQRAEPVLYRGNDAQVRLPEPQTPIKFLGDDVSLNFEQAPLDEVVHAIVGDILQLDYVVDRPLQGEVTLRTRTPVPRAELLGVLESLLKAHDALMIRGSDGRYLISGSQQAVQLRPNVTSAEDVAVGFSTMIIPLRFISATAMQEILNPLADEAAFVRVDNTRNLLMLAGTRAQLNGWLNIISTFDVDMLAGMSVGMFPLENSSVDETVVAVQSLLNAAGGEAGDISGIVRVLPMERLNSILVITPRAHYLDRVGVWIQRLDVDPNARFEKRLYVYPVQNTSSTRLAQLLNSIYADDGAGGGAASGAGQGGSSRDQTAVAPGLSPESIGGGNRRSGAGAGGANSFSAMGQRAAGASGSLGFGGMADGDDTEGALFDVRVVADEENNALMILADGKQYETIRNALDQLDVVATQVIIEASIMEVQLTDELRYGLEWTFKNNNLRGGNYDGVGTLAAGAAGPAAAAGFSYAVSNAAGDISAVLNALSEESLINIISTPSVMVLDNNTASIVVGDQVPVLQGNITTVGGNTIQNVVFKDTGVQLAVRPSVNAGGLITMDIEQSVIDVGPIDSASGQRSFLNRSINSRVAVRSSESVVLGGLIRENATLGDSGVPLLHKIPVVGSLFGTTTTENRRTELLVVITPRALYSEAELRTVSDEMREQVRFLDLVEKPPRSGAKTYEK